MCHNSFEQTKFGRYLLVEKLAEGGMAEIFRAKSQGAHGFEKTLVVKRILPARADHPEFVEMFISEAKMMVKLSHPKIVQVMDFGEVDGRYFIAMEYIKGIDCAQLLRTCALKRMRPSPLIAVHIVADILDALHFAHHLTDDDGRPLKIVHRDISPSNVFISEHGEVKLSDFGIATIGTRRGRNEAGIVRGKYGYLAPEVVTGGPVDHRADVFSAGILLAELLMVQRLFYSKNSMEILLQVRDANLERLDRFGSHISSELRDILEYALARSPSLRYQTAGAFRNALHHYLFKHQQLLRNTSVKRFLRQIEEPSSPRQAARSSDGERVAGEGVVASQKTTAPSPNRAKPRRRGGVLEGMPSPGQAELDAPPKRRRKILKPPPSLEPLPPGRPKKSAMARLSAEEALREVTPVGDEQRDLAAQFMAPVSLEKPTPSAATASERRDAGVLSPEEAAKAHLTTHDLPSLPPPDLEGDLAVDSLFSVLFPLAVDGSTGLIMLSREDEVKEIYLKGGDPYFIASNRPDELFGQYLLKRKVITEKELEQALAVLPKYEGKLGETLVALEVLRPMQMLRLLTTQVRHKMLQAFTWEHGTYTYHAGQVCQKEAAPLGLDAFELIEAGVKVLDDKSLASRLAPYMHSHLVRVEPPPSPPEVFRVDGAPRQVFDALDGSRALAEVLADERAIQDTQAVGRMIYMLLECGLVEAQRNS